MIHCSATCHSVFAIWRGPTAFYDATMAALGYVRVFAGPASVAYGLPGSDNDRLRLILAPDPITPPGPGFHLAFVAPSRAAVDRFHRAALRFGGIDQGPPGLRPHYGPELLRRLRSRSRRL